jgi:hypothetical protein
MPNVPNKLVNFVCRRTIACLYMSDDSISEAEKELRRRNANPSAEGDYTTSRRRRI